MKIFSLKDFLLERSKNATKSHRRRRKKSMNESSSSGIMNAFDMDDTLLKSPKFSDFYENGLPDSNTGMGSVIDDVLKKNGLTRDDVEIIDKRITVDSDKAPTSWDKNHTGRSVMPKPGEFYSTKDSLGKESYPKIEKMYRNSHTKSIITGRSEEWKDIVIDNLKDLDLYPNEGLYMCPSNIKATEDIAIWKSSIIQEMCEKYDFVHFYEDKLNWINIIRDNVYAENLIIHHVKRGEIIDEY